MTARPSGGRLAWLTRPYVAWLGAGVVSRLGDAVVAFALTWTSTGLGGGVAGWLRTAALLPTVLLLLAGGVAGDRWGQRRWLLATTSAQLVQYGALWLMLGTTLPLPAILAANAVAAGALQGLRAPSTAGYARQLVAPPDVARAVGLSTTVGQVVAVLAPAAGATAFAALGLRGATAFQLLSFLGVLAVLLLVTPPHSWTPATERRSLWREAVEGVTTLAREEAPRRLLLATALVAGSVLPLVALLLPLLGRHRGWGPGSIGLLEGAWLAGSTAASLVIGGRYAAGSASRGLAMRWGPVVAAAAMTALALGALGATGELVLALVASAVLGIGTSMFTANVAPMFVAATPPAYHRAGRRSCS